jgi:hypothetical protein
MPTINDGTTVPLTGFPGTLTGTTQQTVEMTNGIRKTERVMNESNEAGAVVFTGKHKDVSISGIMLATSAPALRMSVPFAYNSVNYRTTAFNVASTRTLRRFGLTGRKEASMTYTLPA